MTENLKKYPMLDSIYRITSSNPVMSGFCDQLIETSLFQFFKPQRVIELGAATGNWCILMNQMCKTEVDQHYILVDDFSWSFDPRRKHFKEEYKFPLNKIELETHLLENLESFEIIDSTIDNIIDTSLKDKVDLVRIDCDPCDPNKWNDVINWIDQNGSENLIVLSDDISPTISPYRMLLVQQLVSLNKLKLIWIGEDSAAWCRPNMYDEALLWQNHLTSTPERELLIIDHKKFPLYGYEHEFILTRRNELYDSVIDSVLYNQ